MELRHLRYFVVVAEEQNVTRAAERLHVSQPPLSRQIRDLEQELGVELFRRTAKSLALTEPGKIFLNEARAVLLRAEQAVMTVRAVATGERGQLRIGYAPSLTVELLPKALRAFESVCPGVRVTLHDLSTEECVQRLMARKLDVALTVRPSKPRMRGLAFEKLLSYPLCCAVGAAHPLARKRSVRLDQLQRERFMVYSQDDYPEYLERISTLFKSTALDSHNLEEYDSATGLMAAVEAGRGIALVSASMKCLTGPQVKLLPLKPAPQPIVVGVLAAITASALTRRFIATVKEVASDLKVV
jgi:DNA-binding transcriptional LysR family regulator